MPTPRPIIIIAKTRPFDEAQWMRLLTAFAYVLHERRNVVRRPGGTAERKVDP